MSELNAKNSCQNQFMPDKYSIKFSGADVESYEVSSIPSISLQRLEADCFWCFSKLLDGIQDNYTFAQPGIQTRINQLQELVSRIDS